MRRSGNRGELSAVLKTISPTATTENVRNSHLFCNFGHTQTRTWRTKPSTVRASDRARTPCHCLFVIWKLAYRKVKSHANTRARLLSPEMSTILCISMRENWNRDDRTFTCLAITSDTHTSNEGVSWQLTPNTAQHQFKCVLRTKISVSIHLVGVLALFWSALPAWGMLYNQLINWQVLCKRPQHNAPKFQCVCSIAAWPNSDA